MTLKQKTVSGLLWSFIDNFTSLFVTFIVGIILARLLTPREFGLIGMTSIFIAVSNSFVQSGFTQALIRKQNCTDVDYSTVFYFNFLVSVSFYCLLFFSGGIISDFFNEPQLTRIIQVLSLVIIINGLTIVQQAQLTKAINFKLQTKVTVFASVISGLAAVFMALNGYGIWSLVALTLANALVILILLWMWNGWRPSLVFSLASLREMFSFGSRLLVSGLIDTTYRNIYLLVIGRFFSTVELGYYTRADSFRNMPSQNITSVIQRVSYPILATLQDNVDQLREAYKKLITNTMLLTFVLMLGMAAVAEPMVLALIGEQWQPSVIYLQLLCFVGMFYPLHALNLNMLQIQGRSDLFLRLEVIKKSLAVPTIILGILFGIKIMLVGMIFNTIIAYFLNSYWSGRFIGYSTLEQIRDILPSFGLAASVSLVVFLIGKFVLSDLPYFYQLSFLIGIGALLTIGLAELWQLDNYLDVKEIALSKLWRKAVAT